MITKKRAIQLVLMLALVVLGIGGSRSQTAYAASAVKICAVSYIDESILVITNGNSKIYYATESDASRNNWEVIEVGTGEKVVAIDISWLSASTDNILKIKGDADSTQSRVTVKKIPQKLEVSIDYSSMESLAPNATIGQLLNIMATEGDGNYPINFQDLEWKKGDRGRWLDTSLLTRELLESYQAKGIYLYFRIKPVDAVITANVDISSLVSTFAYTKADLGIDSLTITKYPDGTEGRRASKEVKLKIVKKAVLPVTGVDGSKFTVSMKYGQEYRVSVNNGAFSQWKKITDRSVKEVSLNTIVNDSSMDGVTSGKEFLPMTIEVRQYATSKAAASKANTISLDKQRSIGDIILGEVPAGADATNKNIYITYNGSKDFSITIPSASDTTPYEYTVVKDGASFDLNRASWTAITKNTTVKVISSKAPDLSKVYIRMKEIKYKAASSSKPAVAFALASSCKSFEVKYPGAPTTTKETKVFTKGGYSGDIVIHYELNVSGKLPFETGVDLVKLGTQEVPFTFTTTATGTLDPNIVYTLDITISASTLEGMQNCTARALYVYFKNGSVDKTSVKLTIKSPTAASSLSATIKQGSNVGTTAFDVITPKAATSKFVYFISPSVVTGVNKEDTVDNVAVKAAAVSPVNNVIDKSVDNIVVTANQYITIFEVDAGNHVLKYKSYQIDAAKIKQAP